MFEFICGAAFTGFLLIACFISLWEKNRRLDRKDDIRLYVYHRKMDELCEVQQTLLEQKRMLDEQGHLFYLFNLQCADYPKEER